MDLTDFFKGIEFQAIHEVLNWIKNFIPNNDFLSDVATIGGVVISLAIPISINMVTRISERYNSEIVSNKFLKHWDFYLLSILCIIDILFAVCCRFLITSEISSLPWVAIIQWCMLFIFIFLISIFIKFFIRVFKFITDPNYILKLLYKDAEKIFK